MAILPISSVSVRQNRNNLAKFTGRFDAEGENSGETRQPRRSNKLATVPVALLIAMMPTVSDAKAPARPEIIEDDYTEIVTPVVDEALSSVEGSKDRHPIPASDRVNLSTLQGGKYITAQKQQVQYAKRVRTSAGPATILFVRNWYDSEKSVNNVYLIPDDYKHPTKNSADTRPPAVSRFIYHNTNDGNEYGSLWVHSHNQRADGSTFGMYREYKLPDEMAQIVLDLISDDTHWENKTVIDFQATSNPRISMPEINYDTRE